MTPLLAELALAGLRGHGVAEALGSQQPTLERDMDRPWTTGLGDSDLTHLQRGEGLSQETVLWQRELTGWMKELHKARAHLRKSSDAMTMAVVGRVGTVSLPPLNPVSQPSCGGVGALSYHEEINSRK